MPREKSTTVPLPKEKVRELINDCLRKKKMSRQEFAAALGRMFPKDENDPRPRSVKTITNQLSKTSAPLTMDTLAKWCAVLEYPIDDLLAGRPYVDPNSLEGLRRDYQKAVKRIEDLEEEVRKLKGTKGQDTK